MDRDQRLIENQEEVQNTDFDISADLEATNNFYKKMNEEKKDPKNRGISSKTTGLERKPTSKFQEIRGKNNEECEDMQSQDNIMSDGPDLGFDYSNIEHKDTVKCKDQTKNKISEQKTTVEFDSMNRFKVGNSTNSQLSYMNQNSVIGLKSYQNIQQKIKKLGKEEEIEVLKDMKWDPENIEDLTQRK